MSTGVLYLDLFSGASGDMLLGGLVDAGLSLERLQLGLSRLRLDGYELEAEEQTRHGLSGTKVHVRDITAGSPARHLSDVRRIVDGSSLSDGVKLFSMAVFDRLARVEARIHGLETESVHFHELSAVDSLVDIVGFGIAMETLGIDEVYCSPVPLGSGTIQTAHGEIPVPAPATLAILAEVRAPTRSHRAETEIVTPTAAAIVAQIATFRRPDMQVHSVGYGFGSKVFPWANALRAWIGESVGGQSEGDERVVLIECNLDDVTGEVLAFAMERLFSAGALDVWFTPIQMKKGRPGVVLSVLASASTSQSLAEVVLRETTTLGVRMSPPLARVVAGRQVASVSTPWGEVRVKEKWLDGQLVSVSPEYEDCARVARSHSLPLSRVFAEVLERART